MLEEYRIQTYFLALQSLVILAGSLLVASWTILLLVFPIIWALGTIKLEASDVGWFTRRWTFISGLFSLPILFFFYFAIWAKAHSSVIQVTPP